MGQNLHAAHLRYVKKNLHAISLDPSLSALHVPLICQFIKDRYPDHGIMFRSLNTFTEETLSCTLREMGCEFITSRSVYFFNPKNYPSLPSKKRWII